MRGIVKIGAAAIVAGLLASPVARAATPTKGASTTDIEGVWGMTTPARSCSPRSAATGPVRNQIARIQVVGRPDGRHRVAVAAPSRLGCCRNVVATADDSTCRVTSPTTTATTAAISGSPLPRCATDVLVWQQEFEAPNPRQDVDQRVNQLDDLQIVGSEAHRLGRDHRRREPDDRPPSRSRDRPAAAARLLDPAGDAALRFVAGCGSTGTRSRSSRAACASRCARRRSRARRSRSTCRVAALKTPEFARLNPFGQVPVLEDGDLVIAESLAILEYLEERHPAPALLPRDAAARARVRELMLWSGDYLAPAWKAVVAPLFSPSMRPGDASVAQGRRRSRATSTCSRRGSARARGSPATYTLADVCYAPFVGVLEQIGCGELLEARPRFAPGSSAWLTGPRFAKPHPDRALVPRTCARRGARSLSLRGPWW